MFSHLVLRSTRDSHLGEQLLPLVVQTAPPGSGRCRIRREVPEPAAAAAGAGAGHGRVRLRVRDGGAREQQRDTRNPTRTARHAAADQGVPFYVAFPVSTIDFRAHNGMVDTLIEERDAREVTHLAGTTVCGDVQEIAIAPPGVKASNYGFDITPARLVTAFITEKGVVAPSAEALSALAD